MTIQTVGTAMPEKNRAILVEISGNADELKEILKGLGTNVMLSPSIKVGSYTTFTKVRMTLEQIEEVEKLLQEKYEDVRVEVLLDGSEKIQRVATCCF